MIRRLALLVALVAALPAGAATHYVNNSPTGCSGASCSDSNDGATPATAWLTVQRCTVAGNGGDTCLIYPGNYSGNFYLCGSASHNMSGTDASHYTIYKNATPTRPKLCRDSSCTMTNVGPSNVMLGPLDEPNANTYIGHACQYIRMEGMEVHGGLSIQGAGGANTAHNITVTNNDFSGACHNDGNTTLFWLQDDGRGAGNVSLIQIDHNYFHDIVTGDGLDQYAFLKNFGASFLTIEYNSFDGRACSAGVSCVPSNRGIIDEKDTPWHDVIRYNYAIAGSNGNEFVRLAQQCGTCAGNTTETQGYDEIYGNVIVNGGIALLNFFTHDGPWTIHHNTFINPGQGGGTGNNGVMAAWVNAPGGPITELTFKDNIIAQSTISDASLGDYGTTNWGAFSTDVFNNNSYDAGSSWRGGGTPYSTLAAWQVGVQGQGCTNCESNSTEAQFACPACVTVSGVASRTTPCVFTAGSDTPFHLDPTSAQTCRTGSSTLGQRGAYGAPGSTGCVGWTCGASAPPVCGNGFVETGEQCDGANLNGATCQTFPQFSGGTLACSACAYDTSGCTVGSSTECSTPAAGWFLCDGFESGSVNYWNNDLNTDGGRFAATSTTPFTGTYAAQESYAIGTPGDGWGAKWFADNPGLASPGAALNEVYLRWYDKLSAGFVFPTISVKSFILGAFESWAAGYPQPNSWSPYYVIIEYTPTGEPEFTIHRKVPLDEWQTLYQNQGSPVIPTVGVWHKYQAHMKLNTPGLSDGVAEFWIDGVLKSRYTNVNFRGTYAALGWNDLLVSPYANPNVTQNQTQQWDNIVASTQLIDAVCGNGSIDPGEACDDGNQTTETACPYGTPTCTRCNGACTAVLNLVGPYCGDAIANGPEACDGVGVCGTAGVQCNGATCATVIPGSSGTLACAAGCSLNATGCVGAATTSATTIGFQCYGCGVP